MPNPWTDLLSPLIRATAIWVVWLSIAGALLGTLAFLAIRRAGGYRLDHRHARAWHGATLLMMLLTLSTLGAGIGLFEGLYRGTRHALHGERLAGEVYPWIGQLGADAIGAAYFSYHNGNPSADLEAFRADRRPIDAAELSQALTRLGPGAVDEAVALVLREAEERYPTLHRGIAARLARFAVRRVGDALRAWAAGRIRPLGVAAPAEWLEAAVRSAASRDGDPSKLSHDELAAQLVDDALVRPALAVVRLYARAHQALFVPWIPLVLGGPVFLFWVARVLSAKP